MTAIKRQLLNSVTAPPFNYVVGLADGPWSALADCIYDAKGVAVCTAAPRFYEGDKAQLVRAIAALPNLLFAVTQAVWLLEQNKAVEPNSVAYQLLRDALTYAGVST